MHAQARGHDGYLVATCLMSCASLAAGMLQAQKPYRRPHGKVTPQSVGIWPLRAAAHDMLR